MRADFALDYDVVTVERPRKVYLMARFASGPAVDNRNRRPINLSLVIDRSGSMAGAKIDYTRQAASFLVQHLSAEDRLSIVLYNDKVETLLPPEKISNKDSIIHLLERIRVRGTTNLSGGWLEGCRHVATGLSDDMVNRVILMSDGLANRGVTDPAQLITLSRQKREAGVTTTTMGLGEDFNEDLLMEMANAGGGAYYFIESPEVAPEIFNEELSGLLNVVGQNLTIRLTPTSHVSNVRQLNAYPTQDDGNLHVFTLGDIFADEVKSLVVELTIPALATIGEQQIATLRFEYDEINNGRTEHQVREMPVMINVRPPHEIEPSVDTDVAKSVLLLKAAQARQDAVKAADKGEYKQASEMLRAVASEIDDAEVQAEQLDEERNALIEQADQLEEGANYNEYSRKTMSSQAFYTMTDRHDETMVLRFREQQRQTQSSEVPPELQDSSDAADSQKSDVRPQPGVTPTHLTWRDQSFELSEDVIRIGRAKHNEIVLDEKGVSRFHCQIRREGERLLIEDLGSTNGTMLHGRNLDLPHVLSVGDEVYVCDEKLTFHLGDHLPEARTMPRRESDVVEEDDDDDE